MKLFMLPKGNNIYSLQIINGLVGEKHRNLVNIATLFYALKHGMPMLEYDIHKIFFDFLNFEENLKCIA
jgi:hypothetical protein